jgi:hypothetical protein
MSISITSVTMRIVGAFAATAATASAGVVDKAGTPGALDAAGAAVDDGSDGRLDGAVLPVAAAADDAVAVAATGACCAP